VFTLSLYSALVNPISSLCFFHLPWREILLLLVSEIKFFPPHSQREFSPYHKSFKEHADVFFYFFFFFLTSRQLYVGLSGTSSIPPPPTLRFILLSCSGGDFAFFLKSAHYREQGPPFLWRIPVHLPDICHPWLLQNPRVATWT